MSSFTVPVRSSVSSAKKATKQLSMDNYFGIKSSNRSPIIVPEVVKARGKGKGKAVTPTKSPALARKVSVKEERKRETPSSSKTPKVRRGRITKPDNSDESDFMVSDAGEDPESEAGDEMPTDEDEGEGSEDDIEDIAVDKRRPGKSKAGEKTKHVSVPKSCGLKIQPRQGDLPPISDLQLMFDDIISRLPDLTSLLGKNGRRKLRVATMCSGTESPLLALGLMARSMKEGGVGQLEIEHVFSCEIEPYKQAYVISLEMSQHHLLMKSTFRYIERNFKPPILFRDVRELGEDVA